MPQSLRSLIRRIEHRITSAYQFWMNYWYYLGRGYSPRKAWGMASNTL